jgi:hypothetical protein
MAWSATAHAWFSIILKKPFVRRVALTCAGQVCRSTNDVLIWSGPGFQSASFPRRAFGRAIAPLCRLRVLAAYSPLHEDYTFRYRPNTPYAFPNQTIATEAVAELFDRARDRKR